MCPIVSHLSVGPEILKMDEFLKKKKKKTMELQR